MSDDDDMFDDMFKGMEIDDILENNPEKKKKINGNRKGKSVERQLAKLLNEHFKTDEFNRNPGSGNRIYHVALSKNAQQVYSGDLSVPEGFKWVLECKGGYEDDMEFSNAVDGKLSQLDKFIEQVSHDADYCGRMPIICWKRNRKPWLACIKLADYPFSNIDIVFKNRLHYGEWFVAPLELLLKETDYKFWFEVENDRNSDKSDPRNSGKHQTK